MIGVLSSFTFFCQPVYTRTKIFRKCENMRTYYNNLDIFFSIIIDEKIEFKIVTNKTLNNIFRARD